MLRVPDSQLDFESDQVMYFQGERFSGVAFEGTRKTGLSELTYRDGLQDGPSRDWFPAGGLKEEEWYRLSLPHGVFRSFDEDGRVLLERTFEFGVEVHRCEHREGLGLMAIFQIDESDPQYRTLMRRRAELD